MQNSKDLLTNIPEAQRIIFLQVLAKLASTDGKLDDIEKAFIKEVAISYSIPEKRIEALLEPVDDETIIAEVKKIKNRRLALELVKEMCMLAHSDKELSEQETLLIGKIGLAMGIELEKIEQISRWVVDRIIWLEEAKVIFEEC